MRRALALALATATLAGCFGDKEKGVSDKQRAENTVRVFFLNAEASLVCAQLSPNFTGGQKERLTPREIRSRCQQRVMVPQTPSLEIQSAETNGNTGRVVVELPQRGRTVTVVVNLEKIDNRWLIRSFDVQEA